MLSLGSLAFLNPWVLAGLASIPVLWWLLRALPPAAKKIPFPGVRLLLGLDDRERQASRMPWWLLLLRMIAVALILVGFAQPILNPGGRLAGSGPVLLLVDNGWAAAPDWQDRIAAGRSVLGEAEEAGRPVLLWPLADRDEIPAPVAAAEARVTFEALEPRSWAPAREPVLAALEEGALDGIETVWIHDGIDHGTDDTGLTEDLLDALAGAGSLRLIGPEAQARALTPPWLDEGRLTVEVLRADGTDAPARVVALARAGDGGERQVGIAEAEFAEGAGSARLVFDFPPELAGRVSRLVLAEGASAGGAALADGSIRRPAAWVVSPAAQEESVSPLTTATYYIRKAMEPVAEIRTGDLAAAIAAAPPVIVLDDYGQIPETEAAALQAWVEEGGLLLRFAGPRLAAAVGGGGFGAFSAIGGDDPFLPVRLRRGGRALGGALAWGAPKTLGPFPPGGVFQGLAIPEEVDVSRQVLADPSPELAGRVWATLADGTPLVTGRRMGDGRIVLFHVSADAEWSSLPISGLFVEMLSRIVGLVDGSTNERPAPDLLAGSLWRADRLLAADGTTLPAGSDAAPVDGAAVAEGRAGPDLPPGIYIRAGRADDEIAGPEALTVNLFARGDALAAMADAPASAAAETLGGAERRSLGPILIALAIALLALDLVATLFVSGRLSGGRKVAPAAAVLLAVLALPGQPQAQEPAPVSERDLAAAIETTFAFVVTGDQRIDYMSERGLIGLGNALTRRTAVEPGPPMGVDPERDELAFYPVVYWPLVSAEPPSDLLLSKLADYIANGGLLVIDTQDGPTGLSGGSAADMRRIAERLNLPPLMPIPEDHVITRTFYLLQQFPGRWDGGRVWVEALPDDAGTGGQDPSLPHFDRVDDNVSPVIVGSADWAGAWAVDEQGFALLPVGRPGSGDRQRELALRFGVNMVMYALTGNYKSDQVHAPAILERLGQ